MPAAPLAPAFTLRQLSYLVAVAETGTIVGAAETMHVSASTMTDSLNELERILGEQLTVRRKAHGVTLTPAGQVAVTHARRSLADAVELQVALGSPGNPVAGPLAIGCHPLLAPVILPPLLDEFGRRYPDVCLSFVEHTQDWLGDALIERQVDVAFVYDHGIPAGMSGIRLYESVSHIVLPPDHRLAYRRSIALEEIVDEDLILLSSPPSSDHALSVFADRGLTPRIRHRTGSYEAVRTLVGRGVGYALLLNRPVNRANYEGRPLATVEVDPALEPVGVSLIWPHESDVPRRVQALIRFASSVAWTESGSIDAARERAGQEIAVWGAGSAPSYAPRAEGTYRDGAASAVLPRRTPAERSPTSGR